MGTDFMTDTFKQITDSFTTTMRAGMKLQEETARFWTDFVARNFEEGRTNWEKLVDDAVPFSKRNMDRFHRLFDEQASRTLELMRKSVDMTQVQNPAEFNEKVTTFWRNGFETIKDSADAFAKANNDMFTGWSELVRAKVGNGKAAAKPVGAK